MIKTSSARHCRTTGISEVLLYWKISVCTYPNCITVVKGALGKHRDFGDYTDMSSIFILLKADLPHVPSNMQYFLLFPSTHIFFSEKHRVPPPFFASLQQPRSTCIHLSFWEGKTSRGKREERKARDLTGSQGQKVSRGKPSNPSLQPNGEIAAEPIVLVSEANYT